MHIYVIAKIWKVKEDKGIYIYLFKNKGKQMISDE